MELLSSNTSLMLQKSLDYLWTKQSCILDNVSNAETPNYKTKYATFEESLQQAVQAASGRPASGKNMRNAIQQAQIEVVESADSTRMDDNGVNITEQMVEIARNGYQMEYVMQAISSDFSLLRTAIGR